MASAKRVHHLLGHLVLRAAVGRHLLFDGDGLGNTRAGDPFGLRLSQGPDLGGLLDGALEFGLALVALHGDAQLRFGDLRCCSARACVSRSSRSLAAAVSWRA